MPTVVREDKENLTAVLTVNLKKEDYQETVDSELRKLKKKVNVKGFRVGKTPMSYIKKLYGKQVLVEEVNNLLNKEMTKYLKDNDVEILGQPLPVLDEMPDFDIKTPEDMEFKYELGLAPELEVKGLEGDTVLERHDVEIDDARIDEEIANIRKQAGTQIHPDDIQESDMLSLNIVELDGSDPKVDGVTKEIKISVDLIKNDKLKKQLLDLTKGESFDLNIFDLEDKEPAEIKKFVLGLEEEDEIGELFRAEIVEIHRQEEAELNQDLFDKVFGPGAVDSLEAFREKLKESIKGYYDSRADGKLFSGIQDMLMEKNDPELPNEFLKKWLDASNEEISAEQIEDDYEDFAKNLKWTLIQGKISKTYGIEVSEEELVQTFRDGVAGYFGGNVDKEMLDKFTKQMMQDEKTVQKRYNELLAEKLFHELKEKVKIEGKKIGWKEFDELLKQ